MIHKFSGVLFMLLVKLEASGISIDMIDNNIKVENIDLV
jgi:hypothetical protein